MTQILNGRDVSKSILQQVGADVEALKSQGIAPKLVVLVVGEDPASAVYVRHKQKACDKTGMLSEKLAFDPSISEEELIQEIERLNRDDSVHGMIVQLPLPDHIHSGRVIKAIDPNKDVDGFHAYNMGKVVLGKEFEDLAPCTPKGVTRILEHYNIDVDGMDAVVIGRSNIVGKPMGSMLLNRGASVTTCHSRTKDLARYTSHADLIVVAVGVPHFLKAEHVKEGAIVIDVGINRLADGKLAGDVDFDAVSKKAKAITPVPGGVGPMTVACLLANTVTAAKKQVRI